MIGLTHSNRLRSDFRKNAPLRIDNVNLSRPLQWDDEHIERRPGLALFDAFDDLGP